MTALTDTIYQNTVGNSEGYPLGVPSDYGFYTGKVGTVGSTPPSDFTAITGWGQIYPEVGQTVNPGTVEVANFETWVHLTSGAWVKVQDQDTSGLNGANYVADFSGNSSIPWNQTNLSDGSVQVNAPPSGYNDHFWPGTRGTYAAGTVDGVYVEATMKTDDPSEHLVANIGADWWRSASAPFLYQNGVFVNNPLAGMSNWVELTTNWQTLHFTSMSLSQLQADPPPPLQGTSTTPISPATPTTPTNVAPTVTQASASPGTGTEHVGDIVTLTLGFSEAVTVNGTPTLSLNDGAKATYVSGSGTSALTFTTKVASTDTNTSALAITGVNLPSGTAIKDASGIAANLSAAVKTFTGLAVSTAPVTPTQPTTPTTPTPPTTPPTPSATKPVLTVADHSLWVAGRGGKVDLGTKVTTTDSNDHVTVNITGLPRYETITDKLDGQTFRGDNITLTAAQVDSGLELHSYYRGGGHPTATLTLTASAKDPTTGAVATAAPQTITVVDPRPATTTTTTTSHHHHHHQTATVQQPVATTTAAAPTTSHTTVPTDHQHTAAASTGALASQGFALLQQHVDPAASTLATTATQPTIPAFHPTGTSMASFASQSFALLNQYLAAHTGHVDPGQFVAALSQATGWGGHDSLLARPQH